MCSQYKLTKYLQLLRTETRPAQLWRLNKQPSQDRMSVYYTKK